MISTNAICCPNCSGEIKLYDKVLRIVRTKGGVAKRIHVRRFQCSKCRRIHRELPNCIHPYKQYEADIIEGVIEGYITSDTKGFEDRPCEMTMRRWTTHK